MSSMSAAATRSGIALVAVLAAALLTGCGSSSSETAATASGSGSGGANSVKVAGYAYEPADLTVSAGTTVTFTNRDSTPHTATSKTPGAFDSGSIDTGGSGEITLEETGTFEYYCQFHPFMKGKITVE
jgi:plastocyanin